MKESG